MKKSILVTLSLVVVSFSFAQKGHKTEIPAPVKTAFAKQFPQAKGVKWEKEDGNFEAEFDLNKVEQSAVFDAQGNLVETEMEIKASDVPKAAMDYAKTHYPGKKIKEMARITDAKGVVSYELEIDGKDLMFDKAGNFATEKKETEDKKDND